MLSQNESVKIHDFDAYKAVVKEKATKNLSFYQWVLRNYRFRNVPYSFVGHNFLLPIYKAVANNNKIYVKKPAQHGISEMLIAAAFYTQLVEKKVTIYGYPTYTGLQDFVQTRVEKAMSYSNGIESSYQNDTKSINNVQVKKVNNIPIYFRGAQNPVQMKTIDADRIILDEIDEWNQNMISVARKRLKHSDIKSEIGASTPTYENIGIDREFKKGSQGYYHLKCSSCNKWQIPKVSENLYYSKTQKRAIVICSNCGAEIDRLKQGEYVHKFPERIIKSYQVNPLVCERTEILPLYLQYQEFLRGELDDSDSRDFVNQELGDTYTPEGKKITESMLDNCRGAHSNSETKIFENGVIGIDIGKKIHCVISKLQSNGKIKKKFVEITESGNAERQRAIIKLFFTHKLSVLIIDALPETGLARDIIAQIPGQGLMAYYASPKKPPSKTITTKFKERQCVIDRTKLMDIVHKNYQNQTAILPKDYKSNREIIDHLKAPVRIIDTDTRGNKYADYVEGGNPDHFYHADVYSTVALEIMNAGKVTFEYEKQEENLKNISKTKTNITELLSRYEKAKMELIKEYGFADPPEVFEAGKFTESEIIELESIIYSEDLDILGMKSTIKPIGR